MVLGTSKGWALGRDNGRNHNVTRGTRIEAYKKNDRTGDREANYRTSCPIRKHRELDTMEGSTPSKTKKGKRPVWEEPVVEVPASLARMNERRMKVTNECDTTARPRKCSGWALWKKGGGWTNRGWKNHERKNRISKQKNDRTECRRCQQNIWNRGRTVRLFEDEQPIEGSNVTCLESRRDTAMEMPKTIAWDNKRVS
jgi:hypothetical protein